ncbi:MAG: glutamine amidotransferase-related protein [Actinomycetes bacterium]
MTVPATGARLQVGLLLCDHLDDDMAALAGDYPVLFPERFGPVGLDLRIYECTVGEFPDRTDECDAFITSGSRYSAYDDLDWIRDLNAFQRQAFDDGVRQVGICFGHQTIAQALGGRVERAAGWGVGVRTFEVVADAPFLEPAARSFNILMSHQDQVVELPHGAELLATADYCPVGGYRVGDRVLCVQGHPEFVPALSRGLLGKRRDRIGPEVCDVALDSLALSLDHDLVARWMARFLAG